MDHEKYKRKDTNYLNNAEQQHFIWFWHQYENMYLYIALYNRKINNLIWKARNTPVV